MKDWNQIAAVGTWVGAVGTWVAGIMTLIAVFVALGLQRAFARRERAALSIEFDDSPDCHRYLEPVFVALDDEPRSSDPVREELWLRVRVKNSGGTAARDVQVRLIEILREGDTAPESRSSLWFKAAAINSTSINLLPRGLNQYFDIAYIVHRLGVNHAGALSFHLGIVENQLKEFLEEKRQMESRSRSRLELDKRYSIQIAALSANADAVHYTLSVRLRSPKSDGTEAALGSQFFSAGMKTLIAVERSSEAALH